MNPTTILRLEGAGFFAVATAAYFVVGGPLWLFVVLALAPDIAMLGYLAGPRIGSRLYNAFHTYLAPVTLGAVGVWLGTTPVTWVALIWAAHIGADRLFGYGLKYPTGFKHTHLSQTNRLSTPSVDAAQVNPEAVGGRDD